jgi:hypothetical protein
MADLSVTIGLDQTELEKGLADAGKSIGKMGGGSAKNPFQDTANKFQSAAGIGEMVAGPIGALAGSFIDAWRFVIDKVLDYVKELIAYATKLRNLSIATGVSVGELSELEGVAQASGVSIETLAHSMNEFNKRMGEAMRKGGEVLPILAKLGIGMDQVYDGSFDAVAGMKALAAAHDAGTDAATLAYYGNKLYGSSFEQLLPIIKRGAAAIDEYGVRTLKVTETATYGLGRLSDLWDNFWQNTKSIALNYIGIITSAFLGAVDYIDAARIRIIAMASPSKAGYLAEKTMSPSISKEDRQKQLEMMTIGLSDKNKKEFMDAYNKAAGPEGKKLTPFGLSEAKGASQMQQMGGGDIAGTMAFSPLTQIEKNTKEIADNTKPMQQQQPSRPQDVLTK